MRKTLAIALCLLPLPHTNAQSPRNLERLVRQQKAAEEQISAYKFEKAAEQLQKDIAFAGKNRLPADTLEAYLRLANMGQNMLTSTEKVVFIDSVVADKDSFLGTLKLGEDAGTIGLYKNVFKSRKASAEVGNSYTYTPQLRDRVYYSDDTGSGLFIFTSDRLGGVWSEPAQAEGLEDFGCGQTAPFVLGDGTTMYFAAKGEQSLGGYDIFLTRYSSGNGRFLRPENIGMPFNSPDNEYLYAIDETNNIGWLVSDRRQPEGKVCVYVFIPNSARENYAMEPGDTLRSLAMINAIRDSRAGKAKQADEALSRLERLRSETKREEKRRDFEFVVNDSRTCTTLGEFRSAAARKQAAQWLEAGETLRRTAAQLEADRGLYAAAPPAQKKELAAAILEEEKQAAELRERISELEKLIRKAELSGAE